MEITLFVIGLGCIAGGVSFLHDSYLFYKESEKQADKLRKFLFLEMIFSSGGTILNGVGLLLLGLIFLVISIFG
ncbi:hypothetical protein ACFO9Q_05550 [Paenibacillus sp. GCM10023252]|uniref:hypothetical protein n=1 Tax=Paenibacillus sp. GCM10023252 TaxID=3252649 RepID=UPI00361CFAAE